MVNHQRIKLMSVHFFHSGYADHHVEKMYRTIEKHTINSKKLLGGDFNAELGPGYRIKCTSVGKHTLNGGSKRGDWMKHWLMIQNCTALNTMFRKTLGKQTTYRSLERNEKQIDNIIIKRRHLKYNQDAEANDMIHIGSDHRCVMATFRDHHSRERWPRKTKKDKLETTKQDIRKQTDKNPGKKNVSSKTDTKRSLEKSKKKLKP